MAEPVALGISGLSVPPGTHLCGFYRGAAERNGIVLPYVDEGMRSGDKCLCAVDLTEGHDLRAGGGQLDLMSPQDVYLGNGDFSAGGMFDFWDTWALDWLAGGEFSFARVVGEMTWAVTEVIGQANLVAYESELNRFAPRYPQVLLCLYDLDRFTGALLMDIIKTHPKVLMGSTVLENLYYLSPDELSSSRS